MRTSQEKYQRPLVLLIALSTLATTLWRYIPLIEREPANLLDWPFFTGVLCGGWYLVSFVLLFLGRHVPQAGYFTAAPLCVIPLYELFFGRLSENATFLVGICVAALLAAVHFILCCDVKTMRRSHLLYALVVPGVYDALFFVVMLRALSTLTDDAEGTSIVLLFACIQLMVLLMLFTLAAALLLCALNRLVHRQTPKKEASHD